MCQPPSRPSHLSYRWTRHFGTVGQWDTDFPKSPLRNPLEEFPVGTCPVRPSVPPAPAAPSREVA
jgi:hypothetical protein